MMGSHDLNEETKTAIRRICRVLGDDRVRSIVYFTHSESESSTPEAIFQLTKRLLDSPITNDESSPLEPTGRLPLILTTNTAIRPCLDAE